MIDSVDGIVAMGWEKLNLDSENDRLFFRFGESIDSIAKKLKTRGYNLENKNIKLETL